MPQLFYYKILFLTELLIAEFLFSFRLEKRKMFPLRCIASIILCYILTFLYPLVSYTGWYSSLMFCLIFFLTYFAIMFCFNTSFVNGLFISITAYTVQHLSYEIAALCSNIFNVSDFFSMYSSDILDFTNISQTTILVCLIYIEIYLVVYFVCYKILSKKLYQNGEIKLQNKNMLFLAVLILFVDVIINAFVVYITGAINHIYEIIICIYNILCCVLVFYIQLSLVNTKKMEKEIETTQQLLLQARKQYQISRENISFINLKCHDLKYQIRTLGQKSKVDDDYIKEVENIISIYDTNVKTGNEAVDIILIEKSLLCFNRGIKLTCMADCKKMDFINESDLYVLFGNAVDNAIEAVEKVDDEEKKFIGLTVYSHNNLLSINIHNYFSDQIELDYEGMPLTSKKDRNYHGFGLKSIKLIAKKYGGDVSITTKDQIFNLNIIIPVKK